MSAAPRRRHQDIGRRLAHVLEAACRPGLAVSTGVDLRLRDVPLLNRRPDIVVYDASLADDAVLRPRHCVLVIEVMSPGTVTTDQTDKPTEYAVAGIGHYWRVEHAPAESVLSVFCYRLDPTTGTYASAGVHSGKMTDTDPVVTNSPAREWARREAAKLPPFTPAEARQAALIARRIDARGAAAA